LLAPFLAEDDLVAAFFLPPPADDDFDAVDFLVALEVDFFAPDLDAVDFLAVLEVDFFVPDFVPLDEFDPADFFVLELPLFVPADLVAVEDFLAPLELDLDADALDVFFAPVPELFVVLELFVEDVDFFAPPDLPEPDFEVDFEEVVPDFLSDDGIRPVDVAVAASPSDIIASPAPCSAPAAAPAAALATTSPALAAAALSTLPAASFAFCTNPFLLEPFFAAILLFLLDVCAQYTALPHCKARAATRLEGKHPCLPSTGGQASLLPRT
jgi:hypothetical protein